MPGAKALVYTVVVKDDNGDDHVFGPDSQEIPAWARKSITNPKAWEGGSSDVDEPADPLAGWDESMKNAELQAVIDARNANRAEESQIVPEGAKKADLIAALQQDDAASA